MESVNSLIINPERDREFILSIQEKVNAELVWNIEDCFWQEIVYRYIINELLWKMFWDMIMEKNK